MVWMRLDGPKKQDRFVLTTELQEYVAGNTQRVAKLIAQQADFEVNWHRAAFVEVRTNDAHYSRVPHTI